MQWSFRILKFPLVRRRLSQQGMQMAEKAVYQIKRYNEKYKLFDTIVKEGGKASKESPSGKKVLIIKGEVKEYTVPTVGRRIGRSFIPGVGGHVGYGVPSLPTTSSSTRKAARLSMKPI